MQEDLDKEIASLKQQLTEVPKMADLNQAVRKLEAYTDRVAAHNSKKHDCSKDREDLTKMFESLGEHNTAQDTKMIEHAERIAKIS